MICAVLILALTFGIGGSLLISVSFDSSIDRETETAFGTHQMVLYTLAAVSGTATTHSDEELVNILKQMDSRGSYKWSAIRLSSASDNLYSTVMNKDFFNDDITLTASSTVYRSYMNLTDDGKYMLQISSEVKINEEPYWLDSVFDITPVYESRISQENVYQKVFAVVILIGAAITWLFSTLLTRPLRRLSRATRKFAAGDYTSRVTVTSRDEIGHLSYDFNDMASRLEENITDLTEAVRRQEEFMGSFAHELKTPMTSIIGYADLMRGRSMTDEERAEAANYIFGEGRRLESLSLKLLELLVAKNRDFEFRPCSIAKLVNDTINALEFEFTRRGVLFQRKIKDGVCLLELDMVKSLIINLIDNARKAMDGGGDILVEAEATETGCIIRVTDNGRGMEAAELTKITEAFYRVDKSRSRAQGGAGLGLALCNEIVEMHSGNMLFDSIPGKGTRVTVYLNGGMNNEE